VAERPPIILDCDPGHDDAIAMVVAARHTDLVGITTVAGNAPLERTTRNALIIRDLLGVATPVHSGSPRPLLVGQHAAPEVHGATGLDGADLPEPTRPVDGADAVAFIVDTCRAREGLWLVPTGPLTNIALALRAAPDLAGRIAGISLMGGGTFGNWTATAEFNVWADPHAAAVVFGYGGPLTMCGLDVTHTLQATPERIDRVRAVTGRLASVLADLLTFFSEMYVSRHHHISGAAVHDPCAVMALTHPQLFTSVQRHVQVETEGALTRGMTVIDQRDLRSVPPPTCRVMTSVDPEAAFAVIVEAITAYSTGAE
jgi:inosine-uridine nucleoside N-ribohydrolase